MFTTCAIAGYRSLRDVVVQLGRLSVITGGNGAGKSNLYKALRLLSAAGRGELIASLAREGGLASALWAGPEHLGSARRTGRAQGTLRTRAVSLRIGLGGPTSLLLDIGLPSPSQGDTLFDRDPEIKREEVWLGPTRRPSTMIASRAGGFARVADPPTELSGLATFDSVLEFRVPELGALRDDLASWRFYDALRVDAGAPARQPRVGTRTFRLADDGADLAAALRTIIESDPSELFAHFAAAFPGSELSVVSAQGLFDVQVRQPGMLRALSAAELSDGTLRYLMLLAALLTPRPPALVALNEPEASLHPSLLPTLADLIRSAAERTQVVVVTHSAELAEQLGGTRIELAKDCGETIVAGQGLLDRPAWDWGRR